MGAAPVLQPLSKSLELNFLGAAKLCSFDCPYCNLGPSEIRLNKMKELGVLPSASDVLQSIETALRDIHAHGPALESLIISGNGEPTIHPDFPEIIRGVLQLRSEWAEGKPISILTNGYNLDQRRVLEAVQKLDECVVKIDVGNERLFKTMNAPLSRVTLQKVIGGVRLLKNATIQSMFCRGTVDNTGSSDLEDWIEVMALLQPRIVRIQGLSADAIRPGLIRCDEDTLHTIASKLERRTGIKALISL